MTIPSSVHPHPSISLFNRAVAIQPPIVLNSSTPIPRVVKAGEPIRIPLGSIGLRVSKGIMFMLTVMPHKSNAFSAIFPPIPKLVTSTKTRWLSVPPLINLKPCEVSDSARAFELATTCRPYSLKLGSNASAKQTAFPAKFRETMETETE